MRFSPKYLSWVALLALATASAQFAPADEPVCQSHGTAVNFVGSPAEAAKVAQQKEKLVFVLHVSGLFEEPDYT